MGIIFSIFSIFAIFLFKLAKRRGHFNRSSHLIPFPYFEILYLWGTHCYIGRNYIDKVKRLKGGGITWTLILTVLSKYLHGLMWRYHKYNCCSVIWKKWKWLCHIYYVIECIKSFEKNCFDESIYILFFPIYPLDLKSWARHQVICFYWVGGWGGRRVCASFTTWGRGSKIG